MGGVIGRVFNEFAVVLGLAVLVSGFVSLTLTPMLASRFLRTDHHMAETGIFLRVLERGYMAMLRGYEWSLGAVLRHQRSTLAVTVALTGYLLYVIPKGLFPVEDTGFLTVATEAAEDISFAAMVEKQSRIDAIIRAPRW
jgi:hydrophobic/amphiphilic exporter-1 (mainly G- bacteria), HAE1 family